MDANTESGLTDQKTEMSGDVDEDGSRSPKQIARPPRNTSSKYDFVKVRVWLGENANHYYVLSRFLLSRMLTVTKIPNHVAIKIALELKKLLVDNSLLDVSQFDLEANLFKLMERRGYGEEYINRYKMMTRFHHQRVPLIIVVCGTACVGKSTIATQLAQRLNLPNVLQTDMVYELLRTSTDAPLTNTPVWERDFESSEEFLTEFCRECRIVRKGLDGDLKKAIKDGKPVIIEGIHLDPAIYLMENDDNGKMPSNLNIKGRDESKMTSSGVTVERPSISSKSTSLFACEAAISGFSSLTLMDAKAQAEHDNIGSIQRRLHRCYTSSEENLSMSCKIIKGCPLQRIDTNLVEGGTNHEAPSKGDSLKSGANAIVIPIVLKMAENDHEMLLEEWITCRSSIGASVSEIQKEMFINNLQSIQDYLCSFESQGVTVVNISATTFQQTLDWLHSHLLQRIEEGIQTATTKSSA